MTDTPETAADSVARLLHEAAETHHQVYRITDGDDPDWASWYANWLLELSELPVVLGDRPVRSELVWMLVDSDKAYTAAPQDGSWEDFYASRIIEHFT
jgi:hypothetical protein